MIFSVDTSKHCSGWYLSCKSPALFDESNLENYLTKSHDISFLAWFGQSPIIHVYWHSGLRFNYSSPSAFMDLPFTIFDLKGGWHMEICMQYVTQLEAGVWERSLGSWAHLAVGLAFMSLASYSPLLWNDATFFLCEKRDPKAKSTASPGNASKKDSEEVLFRIYIWHEVEWNVELHVGSGLSQKLVCTWHAAWIKESEK